jgi:hypothetical protein
MRWVSSKWVRTSWPLADYVGRHMLQNARHKWLVVLDQQEIQRNSRILSRFSQKEKIRHSTCSKNFPNAGKVS